jgi:hypothetical protein
MARYFREDGFEAQASVANILTAGVLLAAPGAGKIIYLLGVNSHANTTLRQNNGSGAIIMNVAGGNADFPCSIKVDGSIAIYSTAADAVSLFYYVE